MSKRTPEARDETGHLIRELHGITLLQILEYLVERIGWEGLASRITINCFRIDPSIKSSLVFLRRTPWARAKVEELYIELRSSSAPRT
ncbi:MAG TPA: VF530 family protein [Labilithrix sp.]|nr:VF530 family protein [Labilithrix sp.]